MLGLGGGREAVPAAACIVPCCLPSPFASCVMARRGAKQQAGMAMAHALAIRIKLTTI